MIMQNKYKMDKYVSNVQEKWYKFNLNVSSKGISKYIMCYYY